jgi:hypothetical protein
MKKDDRLISEIYQKRILNTDKILEENRFGNFFKRGVEKVKGMWSNPFAKKPEENTQIDQPEDNESVIQSLKKASTSIGSNALDPFSSNVKIGGDEKYAPPVINKTQVNPQAKTEVKPVVTPQKKRETSIFKRVKPNELSGIYKGKDPSGYKVPDELKDPDTNKMTGPEVMEYLGVDIEELNYLVTKAKAFSFKNNELDASKIEGDRYLAIQNLLKDRDNDKKKAEEELKKQQEAKTQPQPPVATKKVGTTKKAPAATKKVGTTKKPSSASKANKPATTKKITPQN